MNLFIFGATGDLVRRKVVPALLSLNHPNLNIIALGRREFTDSMYQALVCEDDECRKKFEPKYYKVDFGDSLVCEDCDKYLSKNETNLFYSALPPGQIEDVLKYVGLLKKGGFKVKLLIEKPFGTDLKHAKHLVSVIDQYGLQNDLFISDHYLFKDGVRKVRPRSFSKFKMVSLEDVGLEKRVGYFDRIGTLKDMIQSHFLNTIFRILNDKAEEFSDFKVDHYVRGQYLGYAKELGKKTETETYVSLGIKTKNKYLEFISGKRFDSKLGYIEIDGKRTDFGASKNDYKNVFSGFINDLRGDFATIDESILAWEIIEKIEMNKKPVVFYPIGMSSIQSIQNGL
ncbi:MAG: hypothetical protein A3H57_00250 [Candidatus Taylorbacteria bacterium RIFCSPLOWO2_02_FULL_43_11]|uniref:Glucose-6-phosphate dehydrogenase NAD-binding domain-containing protein n=1 Tax=Candidatus Taylorbacteria bacterium RIFCSPHIGHO2_02_FULL_43_32b TaxID=1802306 RepID=A0A1G2MF62_9BACT|nr:MAG: hypothetical protein A2743_00685 [Candidatus Taylorbacteria bacterium RIFCSPHIGHO2_01_FULL_43_47]OHA22507.1 MAG: hypothetical protein A3C72_00220 [Candidatus Taylorbacteria bacterium RIFCSPHIGHO2_02_FULL_43_32b]OHA29414.1 MAG: hypothetical protein A3B08_03870 [Candidatus Taylorbacteria bacterium RIFCSPLOWO2_01_FULL_43_44]OHA35904.1 MAG: hypothetical protein A3H57_00250 [Candidatus Taylorbacteria bacterium RIFCSPLOWO2_02_FULL_43_11]